MPLIQSWRWFGPKDPITLGDIKQTGATGIVTAMHEFAYGECWPEEAIRERKALIESYGFTWSAVESVPIHEDIKTRSGNAERYIENYRRTLENLGKCGLDTVCYNFMPVLDWSRTNIRYTLPDGSMALRFEWAAFAAFDLYILQRAGAEQDYSAELQAEARAYYEQLNEDDKQALIDTVLLGLPGTGDKHAFTLESFREALARYDDIDSDQLKANLYHFLDQVIPTAEAAGVHLAIHPDDPPFPLLGLPRVVSTATDIEQLYSRVPSEHCGLTFCAGSFSARADNNLVDMLQRFGDRVHFLHLRSTAIDEHGNFHEADHLGGGVDMYALMKEVVLLQRRRNVSLPMRPDHGHQMLEDLQQETYPGYSKIGRLRGLAELRGLEMGIARSL